MSHRQLLAAALSLALCAGACTQADSPDGPALANTAPTLAGRKDANTEFANGKTKTSETPVAKTDQIFLAGCGQKGVCQTLDGNTAFIGVMTSDPAAVAALQDVRTPADISFISPSDTIPAGPGPGHFRNYMLGPGAAGVDLLLSGNNFIPSDTIPAGPGGPIPNLFFSKDGTSAMLFLDVQELANTGAISRSPQPDGSTLNILLGKKQQWNLLLQVKMMPSDTIPAGPGGPHTG